MVALNVLAMALPAARSLATRGAEDCVAQSPAAEDAMTEAVHVTFLLCFLQHRQHRGAVWSDIVVRIL